MIEHARASEATVTLGDEDGRVVVEVADNGAGFDPAAPGDAPADTSADGARGGMGLRSMRERAAAAGIDLRITSSAGAGTTVRATAAAVLHAAS